MDFILLEKKFKMIMGQNGVLLKVNPDGSIITDDVLYQSVLLTVDSVTKILGETRDTSLEPYRTEPIWRLTRFVNRGIEYLTQVANGGEFDQIFNDWETIFGDLPFLNEYSIEGNGSTKIIEAADGILHDTLLLGTNSFSVAFKLHTEDINSTYIEKASSSRGLRIRTNTKRLEVELRGASLASRIKKQTVAQILELEQHINVSVIVTYDGSEDESGLKIYIQGVEQTYQNIVNGLDTSTTNGGQFTIMARSNGADKYSGKIDEVCLWDTELSAASALGFFHNNDSIDPRIDLGDYENSDDLISYYGFTQIDRDNAGITDIISDLEGSSPLNAINILAGNYESPL